MKATFYKLRNDSMSEGTYLIDGEYKSIYPGEKLELSKAPVSWTSNVSMTVFRRETNQEVILNRKKKTVKN